MPVSFLPVSRFPAPEGRYSSTGPELLLPAVAEREQSCDKRTFQEHDPQIVDDGPAKENEQHRPHGMNGQPCRGVKLRIMEHMMPEIRAEQVAVMQQIDAKGRAGEQIDVFMIGQIHLGKINVSA